MNGPANEPPAGSISRLPLELHVEDDGSGLSRDYPERRSRGCGIRNTEERLRAMYGEAARFEVAQGPRGGAAVNISIPYLQS